MLSRRAQRHRGKLAGGAVAMVLILVCSGLGYRVYREQQRIQTRDYERSIASAAMKVLRGELVLTAGPMDGATYDFFLMVEYRDLLSQSVTHTLEIALEDLATSVARFPRRVEARFFRAKGLWLLGRKEDALREVEGALGVDPDFAPAVALRATLHDELDTKLDEMVQAHKKNPADTANWGAIWAKALSLARHSDWEKAAAAYNDLIAIDGSDEAYPGAAVEFLLRRGIANLFCKRYIDAALDFQAAQTRARVDWGKFLEPGILLGNALYLIPAERLADEIFAHILKGPEGADPNEASLWIAGIYATAIENLKKEPEKQLPVARKVVEVRPTDSMSHVVLGRVLISLMWCQERSFLKGSAPSLEELRAELASTAKRALELGPHSFIVAGFSSKALEAQGKFGEALAVERGAFALERQSRSDGDGSQGPRWESPPRPAPGSQWSGAECEEGYFEVLGRVMDPGLNSPGSLEWGLGISADGRQIVFSSDRLGGAGSFDIYSAFWDDARGAFFDVRRLAGVSSEERESAPSLSGDGKFLYLHLFRPLAPFAYYARASWDPQKQDFAGLEEWPEFRVVPEEGFMGPPSISFDGKELFFSAKPEYHNVADQDLYVAWRGSTAEKFSRERSRLLKEISSPFDDLAPSTSKDGKTIFWTGFFSDSHAGFYGRELVRSSV